MDKKDWRGQLDDLLTEYHSRAYCEVEGFVYDDDDRSTDEIQKEITNLVQQEIDRAREEQNKKIEDVINEELKQGNVVILKKSEWFKKLLDKLTI